MVWPSPDRRMRETVHSPRIVENDVVIGGHWIAERSSNGTDCIADHDRRAAKDNDDEYPHQEPPTYLYKVVDLISTTYFNNFYPNIKSFYNLNV
jgi:hypothetical protein